MSDDPRQGVVDADGLVHGVNNLYVAGSSVFPTYGSSNPTLNLMTAFRELPDTSFSRDERLRDRFQARSRYEHRRQLRRLGPC
jgi:hypothetical protein